jgi:hypothetical protein
LLVDSDQRSNSRSPMSLLSWSRKAVSETPPP